MIICRSNVREGGDDRFYVTVGGIGDVSGVNAFHTNSQQALDRHEFVRAWLAENCVQPASIYGNTSIVFDSEDDAILFWMTFKP